MKRDAKGRRSQPRNAYLRCLGVKAITLLRIIFGLSRNSGEGPRRSSAWSRVAPQRPPWVEGELGATPNPKTAVGSTLWPAADGLGVPWAGVPFVTVARHPQGLPPESRAPPASQAGHQPSPSYGDATVSAWRDHGVVPMGVDPHGNHTVTTPGRHRGHTSTAGWGGGERRWPWKDRFPPCGQPREPSLSQKWTGCRGPVEGGPVGECQTNPLGSACARPPSLGRGPIPSAPSCRP